MEAPATRATDPDYLRQQYHVPGRVRARLDAHRRFSEQIGSLSDWVLAHLNVREGDVVLDAASGPGAYLPTLMASGARVAMLDTSRSMLDAALDQVSGAVADVTAVNGTLQSLPFAAGSFARVMANHVLYHLPGIRAALEELRRVLRRGGRIVLATNARDHNGRMRALHDEAARDLGYSPVEASHTRFTFDDLPLVQSVFPAALARRRADAFVYPTTADALAYYGSALVDLVADPPRDAGHREPLMERVGAAIQAIIEREGAFRVPKTAGCFVADV